MERRKAQPDPEQSVHVETQEEIQARLKEKILASDTVERLLLNRVIGFRDEQVSITAELGRRIEETQRQIDEANLQFIQVGGPKAIISGTEDRVEAKRLSQFIVETGPGIQARLENVETYSIQLTDELYPILEKHLGEVFGETGGTLLPQREPSTKDTNQQEPTTDEKTTISDAERQILEPGGTVESVLLRTIIDLQRYQEEIAADAVTEKQETQEAVVKLREEHAQLTDPYSKLPVNIGRIDGIDFANDSIKSGLARIQQLTEFIQDGTMQVEVNYPLLRSAIVKAFEETGGTILPNIETFLPPEQAPARKKPELDTDQETSGRQQAFQTLKDAIVTAAGTDSHIAPLIAKAAGEGVTITPGKAENTEQAQDEESTEKKSLFECWDDLLCKHNTDANKQAYIRAMKEIVTAFSDNFKDINPDEYGYWIKVAGKMSNITVGQLNKALEGKATKTFARILAVVKRASNISQGEKDEFTPHKELMDQAKEVRDNRIKYPIETTLGQIYGLQTDPEKMQPPEEPYGSWQEVFCETGEEEKRYSSSDSVQQNYTEAVEAVLKRHPKVFERYLTKGGNNTLEAIKPMILISVKQFHEVFDPTEVGNIDMATRIVALVAREIRGKYVHYDDSEIIEMTVNIRSSKDNLETCLGDFFKLPENHKQDIATTGELPGAVDVEEVVIFDATKQDGKLVSTITKESEEQAPVENIYETIETVCKTLHRMGLPGNLLKRQYSSHTIQTKLKSGEVSGFTKTFIEEMDQRGYAKPHGDRKTIRSKSTINYTFRDVILLYRLREANVTGAKNNDAEQIIMEMDEHYEKALERFKQKLAKEQKQTKVS